MKNKKICFTCSAGGHFEQIKQLKEIHNKYDCFYAITKTKSTSQFKEKKYLLPFWGRKNKISYVCNVIIWFIYSFYIIVKERPDVVISTGAGDTVPLCIIAKLFKRKVIFIETFARRKEPSKTGKFMYKYADLFIVQWKELLEFYPTAIYGGWIY